MADRTGGDTVMTLPPKFSMMKCPKCGDGRLAVTSPYWLKKVREKSGVTQTAMAARIGFSKGYLCDVEHGRRACTVRVLKAYEAMALKLNGGG